MGQRKKENDMYSQMCYMLLGANIRMNRIIKKKTQVWLAKKLRMARVSIVGIESGRQRPPIDCIYRIASFLGIPVGRLLPWKRLPKL